MDKLKFIKNGLELTELTTEAATQIKNIDKAFSEIDDMLNMFSKESITFENAAKRLPLLTSDSEICQAIKMYSSTVTTENASIEYGKSVLKSTDMGKKLDLFIMSIFKMFYATFRKIVSKIILVGTQIENRTDELIEELKTLDDSLSGTTIKSKVIKDKVMDMIGGYILQNDHLELDGGITSALVSLKDYSKIPKILTNLNKWNTKVLTTIGAVDSYQEHSSNIRYEILNKAWSTEVINRKLPGTMLKINSGIGSKLKNDRVIRISDTSMSTKVFDIIIDATVGSYTAYSVNGRKIKVITGYSGGIGILNTFICNIVTKPEDVKIEYPSVNILNMFTKISKNVNHKELSKEISKTINDIEKELKPNIDNFVKDSISKIDGSEASYGVAFDAREILTKNLHAMNKVALDSVIDAVSNHSNLLKYAELMVDTIKLETNKKD